MPAPVKIIIIDTGAPKGQSGRSFVADESDPADLNGHATNVAEVIRQRAPDAQLLFFKAIPKSGHGSPTDLANALFAAAAKEPDIAHVSLAVPRRKKPPRRRRPHCLRRRQRRGRRHPVAGQIPGDDFRRRPGEGRQARQLLAVRLRPNASWRARPGADSRTRPGAH